MALFWNNQQVSSYKGRVQLGVWLPPDTSAVPYTTYVVTASDAGRLDVISAKVYGNERYFWVLAQANNLMNPISAPDIGMVLRVPNLQQYLELWNSSSR